MAEAGEEDVEEGGEVRRAEGDSRGLGDAKDEAGLDRKEEEDEVRECSIGSTSASPPPPCVLGRRCLLRRLCIAPSLPPPRAASSRSAI